MISYRTGFYSKLGKGLIALALAGMTLPAFSEEVKASNFVPVWLNKGANLTPQFLKAQAQEIAKVNKSPQHIVVLIHGYHVLREESTKEFNEVGARVSKAFGDQGMKTVVVGLQWESAIPGSEVPWEAEEAYYKMIDRSRKIGHYSARQVLLNLQKSFPKAHIHLMGHSMGCELAAAALFPNLDYKDEVPKSAAFEPRQELRTDLVTLAGSDLDANVWKTTNVEFKKQFNLLWMTVTNYTGKRDRTLQFRKVSRGLAGGSAYPVMTDAQYKTLFNRRALMLDWHDIPEDHELVKYYNDTRLDRLARAVKSINNPKASTSPEMSELDKVMKTKPVVADLQPFLDGKSLGSVACALWRIENLLCGSSAHLSDGTIEDVTRKLRVTPQVIWQVQRDTKCKTIKQEIWPTDTMMTTAGAPAWAKPK